MKAKICRYGAYGDIVHMSHLPRLLKENGYDTVDVETNFKGYQILVENPFIDNLKAIEPHLIFDGCEHLIYKHWGIISDGYDKFINLYNSIEHEQLALEGDNLYYMSNELRRVKFSNVSYYDIATIKAGFPELVGQYTGEYYFTEEEQQIVEKFVNGFKDKFTVMINLSGTGPHKRFIQAEEVARKILQKFSDSQIILTGGPDCKVFEFAGNGITSIVDKFPFRQALHVTKYVDASIGMESGLMCGSSMWGTPTIQLMTAASIANHCKYAKNDYSLQSPAYCSPCHKGPYQYYGCPHKDGNPLCVYFNLDEILTQIGKIYDRKITA